MSYREFLTELKSIMGHRLVCGLILLIISVFISVFIYGFIMQPNVEYEKCPTYIVNSSLIKSVHCISLKNTGYAPADDVKLEIKADFFQQYNNIEPEIICNVCMKLYENKTIYSFDKFAKGAIVWIYIPSPSENAKIEIGGIYNGGIKIEDTTLRNQLRDFYLIDYVIISVFFFLVSYVLGLLSYGILSKKS